MEASAELSEKPHGEAERSSLDEEILRTIRRSDPRPVSLSTLAKDLACSPENILGHLRNYVEQQTLSVWVVSSDTSKQVTLCGLKRKIKQEMKEHERKCGWDSDENAADEEFKSEETPMKKPSLPFQKIVKYADTTPSKEDRVLINHLHDYNETKDVGQMLIGQMALIKGVRTKDLYAEYGLGLED